MSVIDIEMLLCKQACFKYRLHIFADVDGLQYYEKLASLNLSSCRLEQ